MAHDAIPRAARRQVRDRSGDRCEQIEGRTATGRDRGGLAPERPALIKLRWALRTVGAHPAEIQ
jgi:hypothetical protein